MIEHIEAYLKQHHCRDYFNSYGELVEDDHYFMYREEVNGLIELIVRECAKIGDKALQDGKWPGDVLKEHFGVRE